MNTFVSTLDWIQEFGMYGLVLSIHAGIYAAFLVAVVLPINLLFRRWLTAAQVSLLWGLVLVRLLLPVAPPSSLSLEGLFLPTEEETSLVTNDPEIIIATVNANRVAAASRSNTVVVAETSALGNSAELVSTILPLLWAISFVFIVAWTTFVNWRFSRKVHFAHVCSDPRLLDLWQSCCRLADVRRYIPIILLDAVSQPAVMGVRRVNLLLPTDAANLTDDQLRMIMLHELAHIRRSDVAANWLLVLVRAAQWWNPVYWLAASRFNALREQACDAFVLHRLAGQPSRNYGELLLTLAERTPTPSRWRIMLPVPILGFFLSAFRRRAITARLRALPRAVINRGRWQRLLIGAVTLMLAIAGLTNAKTDVLDEGNDTADSVFPGTFERAGVSITDSTIDAEIPTTRVYDVEHVLRRIAGEDRSLDDARKELKSLFLLPTPYRPRPSLRLVNPKQPADAMNDGISLTANQPAPHYELNGNRLSVTTSEAMHEELQQKLLAWAESGIDQITIEIRFLTINRGIASYAKIPWRYLAPHSPDSDKVLLPTNDSNGATFHATAQVEEYVPVVYSILKPDEAKSLIRAVQVDNRANLLKAPKITVFNGQQAYVSDISQTPFVVGIREVSSGVQESQIAVAEQGTKITLRSVLSADHLRIRLSGRVEFSSLGNVRTASLGSTLPNTEPTNFQVPNLKRLRIDIASEIENGHSLLLGSLQETLDTDKYRQYLYILLTPTQLTQITH
jgi:bla regulator protein BlaR1